MKILHTVQFYQPVPGGMQEVVKQLSERIAASGHEVTVATTFHPDRKAELINGVRIKSFNVSGNVIQGITGDVDEYKGFLQQGDFDIITNFAAQQWATDITLELLPQLKAKKVFVPTGFSALYNPDYSVYFEKMKKWMQLYDMNVFLSDSYRDIRFAKDNNIMNRIMIPNGAGANEFEILPSNKFRKHLNIPEDAFLVLHVGSYTGLKGHEEAIKIFKKANLPSSFLLMIGNGFEQFEKKTSEKYFWKYFF